MRAVAFTILGFFWILSVATYIVDETILTNTSMAPLALDGDPISTDVLLDNEDMQQLANATLNPSDGDDNIIDRIGKSLEASYASVWVVLDLLSGTYVFNVLYHIGVDPVLVTAIKLIIPMLIASQVIWFVAGRY